MRVELIRVEENERYGTFGVLRIDGCATCVTLEPPDRDNRANVSNIPPGRYLARRVNSPKYGNTFEVTGVPGRSHILFHSGNWAKDTKGCILLGQYYEKLKSNRMIKNSGVTFASFLACTENVDEFEFTVIEV